MLCPPFFSKNYLFYFYFHDYCSFVCLYSYKKIEYLKEQNFNGIYLLNLKLLESFDNIALKMAPDRLRESISEITDRIPFSILSTPHSFSPFFSSALRCRRQVFHGFFITTARLTAFLRWKHRRQTTSEFYGYSAGCLSTTDELIIR